MARCWQRHFCTVSGGRKLKQCRYTTVFKILRSSLCFRSSRFFPIKVELSIRRTKIRGRTKARTKRRPPIQLKARPSEDCHVNAGGSGEGPAEVPILSPCNSKSVTVVSPNNVQMYSADESTVDTSQVQLNTTCNIASEYSFIEDAAQEFEICKANASTQINSGSFPLNCEHSDSFSRDEPKLDVHPPVILEYGADVKLADRVYVSDSIVINQGNEEDLGRESRFNISDSEMLTPIYGNENSIVHNVDCNFDVYQEAMDRFDNSITTCYSNNQISLFDILDDSNIIQVALDYMAQPSEHNVNSVGLEGVFSSDHGQLLHDEGQTTSFLSLEESSAMDTFNDENLVEEMENQLQRNDIVEPIMLFQDDMIFCNEEGEKLIEEECSEKSIQTFTPVKEVEDPLAGVSQKKQGQNGFSDEAFNYEMMCDDISPLGKEDSDVDGDGTYAAPEPTLGNMIAEHILKPADAAAIMNAAKSMFGKRTLMLCKWLNPKIPREMLKASVLDTWDNLPKSERNIYISQVLSKFGLIRAEKYNPMINPRLDKIHTLLTNLPNNYNNLTPNSKTFNIKNVDEDARAVQELLNAYRNSEICYSSPINTGLEHNPTKNSFEKSKLKSDACNLTKSKSKQRMPIDNSNKLREKESMLQNMNKNNLETLSEDSNSRELEQWPSANNSNSNRNYEVVAVWQRPPHLDELFSKIYYAASENTP